MGRKPGRAEEGTWSKKRSRVYETEAGEVLCLDAH